MKYYTKEHYELMQKINYTVGLRKVPDKEYSDDDIKDLYEKELKRAISTSRREYNTPPSFEWYDDILQLETFDPRDRFWETMDEETGEMIYPKTYEEAKIFLDKTKARIRTEFENRPPYDPTEDIKEFQLCYKNSMKYMDTEYWPSWVLETVDKRLLALHLIPECAFKRLKEEERRNKRAYNKIEKAAQKDLENQDIPEEIRDRFYFHDAEILALKKVRSDTEMYLRRDGGWRVDESPYVKVIFKKVRKIEREKGLVFRVRTDENGEKRSNCEYLYEELYRNEDGYEIHMMLWTLKGFRYLTIWCEDIDFEYDLHLE